MPQDSGSRNPREPILISITKSNLGRMGTSPSTRARSVGVHTPPTMKTQPSAGMPDCARTAGQRTASKLLGHMVGLPFLERRILRARPSTVHGSTAIEIKA